MLKICNILKRNKFITIPMDGFAKGTDYPQIQLPDQKSWRQWLQKNHKKYDGIWLRVGKKSPKQKFVGYDQALDEALCFGWIDSQAKSLDDDSYIRKFTPRREKSNWSKRNIEHFARLLKEGKVAPAGLAQVEKAKQDGRWNKE